MMRYHLRLQVQFKYAHKMSFIKSSPCEIRGTILRDVLSSLRSLFLLDLCSILFKDGCLHCWRGRSAPFSRGPGKPTQPLRTLKSRNANLETQVHKSGPSLQLWLWMHYIEDGDLAFCFTCVKAYQQRPMYN